MDGHEETPNGFGGSVSNGNVNGGSNNPMPQGNGVETPENPLQDRAGSSRRYIQRRDFHTESTRDFSQAPIVSAPVVQPATGDINIGTGSAKGDSSLKKVLIIAGILVVIGVATVVALVMYFSKPSYEAVQTAFKDYADYMELGPKDNEGKPLNEVEEGKWYFLKKIRNDQDYNGPLLLDADNQAFYEGNGDISEDTEEESEAEEEEDDDGNTEQEEGDKNLTVSEYFIKLQSKYGDFRQKLQNARMDGTKKSDTQVVADEYRALLDLMVQYGDGEIFREKLVAMFIEGNIDAAQELIKRSFPEEVDDEGIREVMLKYQEYYRKELAVLDILQDRGCVVDGEIDYTCEAAEDVSVLDITSEQSDLATEIEKNYETVRTVFLDKTEELSELLGVTNG